MRINRIVLQVIGVMGKYMEGFPSLKSALFSCMRQQDASLAVQKSAIHAFRLMDLDSEVSEIYNQTFISETLLI